MKNEHTQLRGMTRGTIGANELGCAPTTGLAFTSIAEKMARMATGYCMCNVGAIRGDPRMIPQKRAIVCYGACTGACSAPNHGENKIRKLELQTIMACSQLPG